MRHDIQICVEYVTYYIQSLAGDHIPRVEWNESTDVWEIGRLCDIYFTSRFVPGYATNDIQIHEDFATGLWTV